MEMVFVADFNLHPRANRSRLFKKTVTTPETGLQKDLLEKTDYVIFIQGSPGDVLRGCDPSCRSGDRIAFLLHGYEYTS